MTIWLAIAVIYIGGCGWLVQGGSKHIGSWYFKRHPEAEKLPKCNLIGTGLTTLGFMAWVLINHLSLYLIPAYGIGWFLTTVFGWGRWFSIENWGQAIGFFIRMMISLCLFVPLSLLVYQGVFWGMSFSIMFAFGATLIYWAYNYLPPESYYGDESLNLAELGAGMWIIGLAMMLAS